MAILGIGVATFVVFQLLSRVPVVVERAYAAGVGPVVASTLSNVTGLVPFSLAEALSIGYVSWLLAAGWRALRRVRRHDRRLRNALAGGGLRLARDTGVALTVFYCAWGFNYARAPLDQRLGWTGDAPVPVDELIGLTTEAVEAANAAYLELHGVEDAGHPTRRPANLPALEAALQDGWRSAADALDLSAGTTWPYGPVKRLSAFNPVMAYLGVTGFYFPFTAEAHVRRGLPAVSLATTLAHEQAHQRGIAPESDANFLGYVAALYTRHPQARYSALLLAQRQLAGALHATAPDEWQALAARRLPGVRRDLDDMYEYFRRFEGPVSALGRAVNDRYLRANRIEGGVTSYRGSLGLIIAYARRNEGSLIPRTPS